MSLEANKIFAAVLTAGVTFMSAGVIGGLIVHPHRLDHAAISIGAAPQTAAPAAAPPPAGFSATASSGDRTPVIERAKRYLAKMPPAISEQRGHDALFTAARAMVWGFCLPTEDAYALLANEYNHRCVPPDRRSRRRFPPKRWRWFRRRR